MRSGTWARFGRVLALALIALPARLLATTADDLCAPAANPCVVNMATAVTDGSIIDVGSRELRIASGGALDVGTGDMTLRAATLTVNAGGFVRAMGTVSTSGGNIDIQVGDLSVAGTIGQGIDASGGPGGTITIAATGNVAISGPVTARSLARDQLGGTIDITAATATINAVISLLGGFDGVGGDFSIDTTGNLTISGEINADGGDGGGIDIRVGRPTAGADLLVDSSANIHADSTTAGGFAGAIDVLVEGDGGSTGIATVNGQLHTNGAIGTLDLGGASGGCVEIQASGDIRVMSSGAELSAEGGAPDGDGGEIDLTSLNGAVVMQGSATASVGGEESNGGAVTIEARNDATLNGSIAITAGDGGGGEATITSTAGSVIIGRTASVDVSSTTAGVGGGICVESGVGEGTHTIIVEGDLIADGGPSGGAGGGIDLSGGDSVRVAATGSVLASGGIGGGAGGTISVRADPGIVSIEGPLTAAGGSPSGNGGIVAIESVGSLNVAGEIDASGFGTGGQIGIATDTGPLDVLRDLNAGSSTAAGGLIEITAQGDVRLASRIESDGDVAPGGTIEVVGCDVTVCGLDATSCPAGGNGVLSSQGPAGLNRITGRDSTAVLGTMRASNSTGRNELVYNGDPDREPIILGTITPAAMIIEMPSLLPCPECGNRSIEPPETCDDGNMLDGDGCSASCQTEASVPGDANADRSLSPDDIGFTIEEIFDGDGDSVTMVSSGAFRGGPGADSNSDDVVTAADITATLELLAAQ